jgi:hypothetical protein
MGSFIVIHQDQSVSPLILHAADASRRARKLPVGAARNDLRQLAIGLRGLHRRRSTGFVHEHPPQSLDSLDAAARIAGYKATARNAEARDVT